MSKIGIIGGSGLYEIGGLEITEKREVQTPFGNPSDPLVFGRLNGTEVVFLSRHGVGHRIPPHEINYRANIYALKSVGVERIIAVSAVGSLKKNIKPGDLVMIDQYIDRTKCRRDTFFGDGIVAHVSFADPICPCLRKKLVAAAKALKFSSHDGGTYICIEGPMFSSRAESNLYRSWDCSVIGMTGYQEAKLAREAEICYGSICMSTDYDCWHEEEGNVDVALVVEVMKKNVQKSKDMIKILIKDLDGNASCNCKNALNGAIMTNPEKISLDAKKRLDIIIKKYVS